MAENDTLDKLYADIDSRGFFAYWRGGGAILSTNPVPRGAPHLWKWADLEDMGQRMMALVSYDKAGDRRAIGLVNPTLNMKLATTHSMLAALQVVAPGEVAGAHRHSHSGLRLVLRGQVFQNTAGEKVNLSEGDVLVAGTWVWHDLGNPSNATAYWLDTNDMPLAHHILGTQQMFFEPYSTQVQEVKCVDQAELRYGMGQLRPVGLRPAGNMTPLHAYRWDATQEALARMSRLEADPFDDVALDFVNPATGGAVLPNLSGRMQMIRRGVHTKAHRHVSSAIYSVVKGSGHSILGGKKFEWSKGDVFCVPPWLWHEHGNPGSEDAVLFSQHDTPVMDRMGYYREEALVENQGHQPLV